MVSSSNVSSPNNRQEHTGTSVDTAAKLVPTLIPTQPSPQPTHKSTEHPVKQATETANTQASAPSVIILAAGLGQRFGGAVHKALAPLHRGEGTLLRLIRQLNEIGMPTAITLVLGHQAKDVSQAVSVALPSLPSLPCQPSTECRFVINPDYAQGNALSSFAVALESMPEHSPGVWVLFADTVYDMAVLRSVLSPGASTKAIIEQANEAAIAVACVPRHSNNDLAVGVKIASGVTPDSVTDGQRVISDIGPDITDPDGFMVPLVYWPRCHWPTVQACTDAGMRSQWAVVQSLLGEPDPALVRGVWLQSGQVQDIDTQEDLTRVAHELVMKDALRYFRHNISKDERTLQRNDGLVAQSLEVSGVQIDGLPVDERQAPRLTVKASSQQVSRLPPRHETRFVKACRNPFEAQHEFNILTWLDAQPNEPIAPKAFALNGCELVIEWIRGIRLFDLFRLLRQIEETDSELSTLARNAGLVLLKRSYKRQMLIQHQLQAWTEDQSSIQSSVTHYPISSHVRELIDHLSALLHLAPVNSNVHRELAEFEEIWRLEDAVTPFRDATPKNILVADATLAPWPLQAPLASLHRIDAVKHWLGDPKAPHSVRLVDFDFTSTCHLSAPEDDFLSLMGHEGSFIWGQQLTSELNLAGGALIDRTLQMANMLGNGQMSQPRAARAARALLVRYLRFGGRKLMYRLLNPNGYAVRFRHDSPLFYFSRLPDELMHADPTFASRWPALWAQLHLLARAIEALPAWHDDERQSDRYLDEVGQTVRYWQESPLENREAFTGDAPS